MVSTIKEGRASSAEKEEARLEKQNRNSDEIVNGRGAATVTKAKAELDQPHMWGATGWLNQFSHSLAGLGNWLRQAMPGTVTFMDRWQKTLAKQDGLRDSYTQQAGLRVMEAVKAALDTRFGMPAAKALSAMSQKTIEIRGEKISKMQALYYRMVWKDAAARKRLMDPKYGWTQDHLDTLARATADPVSEALLEFFRTEYDRMYGEIDAVYSRMYGMHLPKVEFYVPLRYQHMGIEQNMSPDGTVFATAGTLPSFLHPRVNHKAELIPMDALQVFTQHVHYAAHFIHFAEFTREFRSTMNRPDVKTSNQQFLGRYGYDVLNKWMDSVARGGANRANETLLVTGLVDRLLGGFAVSTLIMNVRTIMVQADSMARFLSVMPPREFIPAMLDLTWVTDVPSIFWSESIQRRNRNGMNPAMQYVMEANKITPTTLILMKRHGMLPIAWADGAFTAVSSAIVFNYKYKEAIRNGASPEYATTLATEAMEEAIFNASQPTGFTSRSIHQADAVGTMKMLLLFMSDPILKSSIAYEAINSMWRKGVNSDDLSKLGSVWLFGLISWLMSSVYRDWFTDDDDDEIWTAGGVAAGLGPRALAGDLPVHRHPEQHGGVGAGREAEGAKGMGPFATLEQTMSYAFRHWEDAITDPRKDPEKFIKEWDKIFQIAGMAHPAAATANVLTNVAGPAVNFAQEIEEKMKGKKD